MSNSAEKGVAPRIGRTTNRRIRSVEPEVWFRIVHVGVDGQKPVSDADTPVYRDQTVEIALGPKGAFENGNVGAVKRRVVTERVVNAVPAPRSKPKHPRDPRTPRVVELLRKAMDWRAQLESGEVVSQAAIARREGITRARVTQVMGLLRLSPTIQHEVLSLPDVVRRPALTERVLRPIAKIGDPNEQMARFQHLIP
jgi:hypothetical protein